MITTLTVSGGEYSGSSDHSFLVSPRKNASIATALFSGVTFSNNFANGLQIQANDNPTLGYGSGTRRTGTAAVIRSSQR